MKLLKFVTIGLLILVGNLSQAWVFTEIYEGKDADDELCVLAYYSYEPSIKSRFATAADKTMNTYGSLPGLHETEDFSVYYSKDVTDRQFVPGGPIFSITMDELYVKFGGNNFNIPESYVNTTFRSEHPQIDIFKPIKKIECKNLKFARRYS